MKPNPSVWHCLEQLRRENNPRLVALIERKDAQHLLKVRAALKAFTTGVTKGKIVTAKRLLAHK